MGKRRTRKDKIIAELRREVKFTVSGTSLNTGEFSYNGSVEKTTSKKQKNKVKEPEYNYSSLFTYDPKLIQKDLLKTSLISILFFAVQVCLFFIIS